jgi:hypothetical protein
VKCSQCYAENDRWASVCVVCGGAVLPIAVCPNGHLLPPDSQECPRCPQSWPEVPPFDGPPILRAALVVERGELYVEDTSRTTSLIEARDRLQPLSLVKDDRARMRLTEREEPNAQARILMRPDGVSVCQRPDARGAKRSPGKIAYRPLNPGETAAVGGVTFRLYAFHVPRSLPASREG